MPLLEAIEQVAASADIPVDARVGLGRTDPHALARLLEEEPVHRVIVPAAGDPRSGLSGDDLVWLLERAPAEVLHTAAWLHRRTPGDRCGGAGPLLSQ